MGKTRSLRRLAARRLIRFRKTRYIAAVTAPSKTIANLVATQIYE
jgi:hypothetical protein